MTTIFGKHNRQLAFVIETEAQARCVDSVAQHAPLQPHTIAGCATQRQAIEWLFPMTSQFSALVR